jgi:hypothetical protein
MRARLRLRGFSWVAPVLVLAIAFYAWTAGTSGNLSPGHREDTYNLLVDGFLHGHTYLPVSVDPRLASLRDPYDPAQNSQYVTPDLRDLVLYHDHFYIYWGAAPAVVLLLPFRALGLGQLPQEDAVLVFSIVALLCSLGFLATVARRWLGRFPPWMLAVAAAVLAFSDLAPWLLRRPKAYEVAIAGGSAFFWAGLLAFAVGWRERPNRWWSAGSSLLFGLALASRPPMAIGIVLVGAVAVRRWRGQRPELGDVAALAVPFGVCAVAVLAYNAQRFGSPLDFGTTKVLGGQKADRFGSLTYVPAGLWYYLLCPVRFVAAFPYFWVNEPHVPFPTPAAYDAAERTAGLLPTAPFVLLLALARVALRRAVRPLRVVVAGLVGAGVALVLFTSYFYWGAVMRYEMDFAALFIVPAALVWFAYATVARRRARMANAVAGVTLAAVSVVIAMAISLIGSDNRLRDMHPRAFASLERAFSPVSAAIAQVAGHPVLASVGGNPLEGPVRYDRLGVKDVDLYLGTGPYPLQVVSPDRRRANLVATLLRLPATPRRAKLLVQVRSADGSIFTVPVRDRAVKLPVSLKSGPNDITIQLFADPPTGIPPYADSADDGAILVRGLSLDDGS